MAKKQAYQTYYRDKFGELRVQLVDAETGKPVTDPKKYTVIDSTEAQGQELTGVLPDDSEDAGKKPIPAKSFVSPEELKFRGGRGGTKGKGKSSKGSVVNNFGFIDKPKWSKYASLGAGLVGGPLVGAAAGAANLGVNAINTNAVNQAREFLGLKPLTTKEVLKNVALGVDEGSIGEDVTIDGKPYGVSLNEAVIGGKTQLTAKEARQRQDLSAQRALTKATAPTNFQREREIDRSLTQTKPSVGKLGVKAKVSYAMGPKRPNKPEQGFVDKVRSVAAESFGAGTKVTITSGQHSKNPLGVGFAQYGSNRHNEPTTMDFQVTRPDGSVVRADDPDAMGFAEAARTVGIIGTGFGTNYMGGNTFHFDEHVAEPGQSNQWANVAKQPQNVRALESAGYLGATTAQRNEPHNIPQARPGVARAMVQAAKTPTTQDDFYSAQYAMAKEAGLAGLMADVAVAQAAIESGYGTSALAQAGNVHGIKAFGFAGPTMSLKDDEPGLSSFRTYETQVESYKDWAAQMERNFPGVLTAKDINEAITGLQKGRLGTYATDPEYGTKLTRAYNELQASGIPAASNIDPKAESFEKYSASFYSKLQTQPEPSETVGPASSFGRVDTPSSARPSMSFGANRPASNPTANMGRGDTPSSGRTSMGSSYSGRGGMNSPSEGAGRFGGSGLGASSYSGSSGGRNSPSEGAGRFGGSGLGSPGASASKSTGAAGRTGGTGYGIGGKSGQSKGPSGGGYGGFGGPR